MATRYVIVSAVMVLGICLVAVAGREMPKDIVVAVPDYQEGGYTDLDNSTNAIVQAHEDIVNELLRQLRTSALPNERQVLIVYSLGRLRNPRATSVLIEKIGLVAERTDPKTRGSRWSKFPAREALVKIGNHASWTLIRVIGSSKFDKRLVDAYACVLSDIETRRYAIMKLKDRIEKATDDVAKKQYQLVMDQIQGMPTTGQQAPLAG